MSIKMRIFLLAMTLFILGTDGFIIAGVLEEIADRANVSVSVAGQLITIFSIVYAISGPIFASLLGNINRKSILVGSLWVFSIGNMIVALSSDYVWLVIGRIISALGASALTPVAIMIAGIISPAEHRGKYISYVFSGMTIATIVGVPIGTFASKIFGYQGVFLTIAICGVIMSVVLSKVFSHVPSPPKVSIMQRILSIKTKGAAPTLLVTVIVFLAAFTVYSYISVYFSSKGSIDQQDLSWILFAFGIGGAIGNLLGGHLTDRLGPKTTIILSLLGLSLSFILISLYGNTLILILLLTFVWGICGWLLAPAQQYRLMMLGGAQSQVLISWNSSSMYLGIGLSGISGALIIGNLGVSNLTWIGSGGALLGVLLVIFTYASSKSGSREADAALGEAK